LRACISVRAWAWDEDDGKRLVFEVRNLQGSLGGHYDTAHRFSLHGLGLAVGGDYYRTCAREGTDGVVRFSLATDSKAWTLEASELSIGGNIGDPDVGFNFSCREAAPGCGTVELDGAGARG
jgi:hypothetical protein